jgi:hypothetical protein
LVELLNFVQNRHGKSWLAAKATEISTVQPDVTDESLLKSWGYWLGTTNKTTTTNNHSKRIPFTVSACICVSALLPLNFTLFKVVGGFKH